ncbi:PREDICTED: uncharacterized protein LOC106310216 [Brassica oleracea var. oleracea]|uniref:DUF4220 domain-containing protein n=1 Tax=Brassica oleracea var. oleracea TaxID=109376 RepID=A0A0D3DPX4_BRAOL|nr:PREDICTED: uncharacterized protein LOC106310216 [Brassica oleracea var. oleracea]
MAAETIPKDVKNLWEEWNIRVLIIFSLSLQAILVVFSPSRKRASGKLFVFLIWFAYLLADWSANYTIGQISDTQDEEDGDQSSSLNHELLAFWAPFLLLHLGGPDTITALALEDNELWRRHLFGLICQAVSTVYVLCLSIPSGIAVPTGLMIVAGVIKFVERIRALYLASSGKFKGSVLRKNEKLMRKEEDPTTAGVPIKPSRELRDLEVVQYAYKLFNISKGLVPDLRLASRGWDESKRFVDSLTPEEALRVLEVELSFMYDDFFTKASILLTRVGSVFRFIAFGCLVSSLCIFFSKKKENYKRFDVSLTYALLIGGIVLELVVAVMICVSDRTIAITRKLKQSSDETWSWYDKFLNWILGFRRLKWERCRCPMSEEDLSEAHEVLNRRFMFRRWSEYIHGYNLIEFCLRISPQKIHRPEGYIRSFFDLRITRRLALVAQGMYSCFASMEGGVSTAMTCCIIRNIWLLLFFPLLLLLAPLVLLVDLLLLGVGQFLEFFGVQDEITEIIFKSSDRLPKDLWEFIHNEVRYKSRVAVDRERAKRISSARGEWTLNQPQRSGTAELTVEQALVQHVSLVDYGQSILLWHIATDLIYRIEIRILTEEQYRCKEVSKMLSDYMMYLMMMKPALMSAVAGTAKMKFTETCSVARTFFGDGFSDVREACGELLSKKRNMMVFYMGDESTLEDACKLAEELLRIERRSEEVSVWGLVSRVWVELLCYAANHCDSKQHVAQLSQGGELVSFVWLFMAHLGIGKHATMHHPA